MEAMHTLCIFPPPRSYPVIDQSSQEALTIVSPTHHPNKRVKVESSPRYADRNGRYSI